MTQETAQVASSEDQMAAELAQLRADRANGDPTDAPAPAPQAPAAEPAAAPAQAEEQDRSPDPSPTDPPVDPAALHRQRSEEGRVAALNRKYQDALARIAELESQSRAAQPDPAPAPAPAQQASRVTGALEKLEKIKEQVKDFPEIMSLVTVVGEALEDVRQDAEQTAKQAVTQAVQPLEPLRRDFESRAQNEQAARYEAAVKTFSDTYPTAGEVVRTDEFKAWLAHQPPTTQRIFRESRDPNEAMLVMDAYDANLRRSGRQSIAVIQSAQGSPTPATPAVRDQSRLRRAIGIPSRQSGAKGALPAQDDFEGSLAFFRQQRAQASAHR